ncbi:AbiV family abortive infection protein [Patescibacteria group bacterium]|nr:AbiV family abortive infection protein [Patescibacteria group bacterium]
MKTNWQKKFNYFEIYKQTYRNAVDLLMEAKILFDNKCYSRSYFLSFTALEEISKSQFAADVYTGFSKEEDFLKFYKEHKDKIKRMSWAHYDANSSPYDFKWVGPNRDDIEIIKSHKPVLKNRMDALYVDFNIDTLQIKSPEERIKLKDADEIIHIVDVALRRIWEMTEYYGHQIGTKGFMK